MSVKVMGAVWDADLPRDEKYVLISYADHAAHDGTSVYPSVGRMAWKTGYSERSIQTITRKLQERGILVDDGRGPKGTNRWRIDLQKLPERPPYLGGENSAPPVNSAPHPRKICTPTPVKSAPEPSCNHHEPPTICATDVARPPECLPEQFDMSIGEIKELTFTRKQWEAILASERSRGEGGRGERTRKTLVKWLERKLYGSGHPAIQVYHEEMERYPKKNQFDTVIEKVGENKTRLDLWRRIVVAWRDHGWNPYNVADMIRCLEEGRVPGRAGNNSHNSRPREGSIQPGESYQSLVDRGAIEERSKEEIEALRERLAKRRAAQAA